MSACSYDTPYVVLVVLQFCRIVKGSGRPEVAADLEQRCSNCCCMHLHLFCVACISWLQPYSEEVRSSIEVCIDECMCFLQLCFYLLCICRTAKGPGRPEVVAESKKKGAAIPVACNCMHCCVVIMFHLLHACSEEGEEQD